MAFLIAGVAFWTIVHLMPAAAPSIRTNLIQKFGEGPYKGLFALDIFIALALIIFGWKSATPQFVYAPPMFASPVPAILMAIAILLMVASVAPNNIRRFIRHPQMLAVIFWGTSHLLSNGDSRSIVLFGGLSAWAVLEIVLINKRDGEWRKRERVSVSQDLICVIISAVAFAALLYFHGSLFGVSPLAGISNM